MTVTKTTVTSKLQSNKRCLNEDDIRDVENRDMLTDMHINFALSLIKKQFLSVDGFQCTSYGPLLNFKRMNSLFIHVLFDGKLHWVPISTIASACNTVKFHDSSVGIKIKPMLGKQIANVIQTQEERISIEIMPVQQQANSVGCGLYALAFAVSLLHGRDPCQEHYDEGKIRTRFLKCIQTKKITPFPSISSIFCCSRNESIIPFCVCRISCYTSDFNVESWKWSECDECGKEFHNGCAKVKNSIKKCPYCQERLVCVCICKAGVHRREEEFPLWSPRWRLAIKCLQCKGSYHFKCAKKDAKNKNLNCPHCT